MTQTDGKQAPPTITSSNRYPFPSPLFHLYTFSVNQPSSEASPPRVPQHTQSGSPIDGFTQTGDPDHFGTTGTNDNTTTTPIVLAPGDVFLNADFGYQPTTINQLGDTIFFDADADGSYESADGEYGIANVTVALIHDTNGDGTWQQFGPDGIPNNADDEPIIATDITDTSGQYLFSGLPDDDYIIWVNDTSNVLSNLTQSSTPDNNANNGQPCPTCNNMNGVTITGASNLNQDFGYTPNSHTNGNGAIGDTIWFDMDGSSNATQDAGEAGIEGVVITLTDSTGNIITTTDENGHYYFGGLDSSATYTVTIAPSNFLAGGVLEGMSGTYDPNGGNDNQTVVDLSADLDGIDLDQDFSYRATTPHRLGNLVWLDLDADGVYSSTIESPIGGVTVDLYRDLNSNGVVDAGEPLIATTVTDNAINAGTYGTDGNYSFEGLPDGDYIVDVSDRDGLLAGHWHSDGPNDGNDNNSQVDPYSANINGADNLTADFGYYVEPAAVGNYVWLDANSDGIQNSSESGIPNVVVTLAVSYPDGTNITVITQTDDNGHDSFGQLLLDEDYNGDGTGSEPTYTISVDTTQTALASYTTTTIDVNSNLNDLEDSENPAGTAAQPVQGQTSTNAVDPVTSEPVIASYDFGFQPVPLAVELAQFEARCDMDAGEITLQWQTVREQDNIGFYLYRGDSLNAEGERITEELIPTQIPGGGQGATYEWLDTNADMTRPIYYWLESVEATGNTHRYAPVTACFTSTIYLPMLQR